jgi:hypothetical protein
LRITALSCGAPPHASPEAVPFLFNEEIQIVAREPE